MPFGSQPTALKLTDSAKMRGSIHRSFWPEQGALGRLRDADKAYAELDMSDIDSVKAAWRAKYEVTSLPDMSDLPRFSSVLRHLPKHCLYENRGRKLLKMARWALLGVQVIITKHLQ